MITWWLFALLWLFDAFHDFAFARLCCLKIPVVRSARAAKVSSDLLDFSLQCVPRAFRCRRCILYERKDANSPLQIFAFQIQEPLCLLALRLTYLTAHRQPQQVQRIRLSRLPPTRSVYCNLNSSKTRNARLWPISQNIKEQKASTMILKARIVNERDNFIDVLKISTKCSEIRKRIADSSRLECEFTTTWICCMLWDDQICHRASI